MIATITSAEVIASNGDTCHIIAQPPGRIIAGHLHNNRAAARTPQATVGTSRLTHHANARWGRTTHRHVKNDNRLPSCAFDPTKGKKRAAFKPRPKRMVGHVWKSVDTAER